MARTLSDTIQSDGDKRLDVSVAHPGEIILSVLPDADADDCLTEATEYVAGLYADADGVSSVTDVGWDGGDDGQRDRVLVRIGGDVR